MPKWFSEEEKEKIRQQLLEQGEKQFSTPCAGYDCHANSENLGHDSLR